VIIVSYESLRSLTEQLGDTKIGLLLCDEAHRLKNAENQTYTALNSINVKRRVLLTGTPVQVRAHASGYSVNGHLIAHRTI
jgi:DNA repair and recombination RAD54-like protein